MVPRSFQEIIPGLIPSKDTSIVPHRLLNRLGLRNGSQEFSRSYIQFVRSRILSKKKLQSLQVSFWSKLSKQSKFTLEDLSALED